MNPSRALAVAAIVAIVWLPIAAGAQIDQLEAERDEIQGKQADVDQELDVLAATDAEISAAVAEVESAIASQRAAVAEAEAAAEEAAEAEREAAADLRRAERDVVQLEQAISEMAVASFVHPPSVDLVQSLQTASLSDAIVAKTYLDARANRDLDLLDLLEEAERQAEIRAADLAAAADAAQAAVEAQQAQLAQLDQERARQQALSNDLQVRIDARLAEAAVLADMDSELAAEIQAEQAALIERLPPPDPEPVVAASADPPSGPTTTAGGTGGAGGGDGTTTTTTVSAPPSSGSTPPLRTVQGITVHAAIADDVDALLTAASSAGVPLSGWGYRSTERQVALRKQNCGPTEYDIWHRPASSCNPPTAVPGRSMHEQGRAIDFTYEGRVIGSRSSPAFQWLSANAASYGLFNLPSEPWHWSTNGN